MTVDINCDMGESFGNYQIGNDEAIMPYISSCNIACGYHGGDPLVILKTLQNANNHQLALGAHPSYPDLQGFGRRSMKVPTNELSAMLSYQICALTGMAAISRKKIAYVKPHGALYNDMAKSEELSSTVINTILQINPELRLIGMANTVTEELCQEKGLCFSGEFFCDRNYNNNGYLVARTQQDAILQNPDVIANRALNFVKTGKINSIQGNQLSIKAETLCIHGDHPNALRIAKAIKASLTASNIQIKCIA